MLESQYDFTARLVQVVKISSDSVAKLFSKVCTTPSYMCVICVCACSIPRKTSKQCFSMPIAYSLIPPYLRQWHSPTISD